MARGTSDEPQRKQKGASTRSAPRSGKKVDRATRVKNVKAVLRRRISRQSSGGSQRLDSPARDNRRQLPAARTFYQPGHRLRQSPDGEASRTSRLPTEDLFLSDQERQGGDEGNEEDEEDEDSYEKLQKLPTLERYRAMGKIFALKFWPWPSPNWWVISEEIGGDIGLPTEEKDALDKFRVFLSVDMGLDWDEWISESFRSQFLQGARSLRSETVTLLKNNALVIFQISDIASGEFCNLEARKASNELKALRAGNKFLYGSEELFPGPIKMNRFCRSECIVRALRTVLLGPRATDGSTKSRRSTSRAGKFAIREFSPSLLAFVATILFFLLSDVDKTFTFNEENDQLRDFFDKRYRELSIRMRNDLPETYIALRGWLANEVFVQEPNDEQLQISKEQQAFDEDFDRDFEAAVKARQARRRELSQIMRQ